MRRHAKASPASAGQRAAKSTIAAGPKARGLFGLLCLLVLGLTAFIGSSAPAAGAAEGESCPNEDRRVEQGSTYLPECRAYEMVSPAEKNLGQASRVYRASDGGGAVAFSITAGTEGATGNYLTSLSIARRTSAGWDLTPGSVPGVPMPLSGPKGVDVNDFSPDFGTELFNTLAPMTEEDAAYGFDLFLSHPGSALATWVSKPEGVTPSSNPFKRHYDASSDLSRVFFTTEFGELLPGAGNNALYEWHEGSLRLVSRMPDGTPTEGFIAAEASFRSGAEGNVWSNGGMAVPHGGAHAVSEDGLSVYWEPYPAVNLTLVHRELYLSRLGQSTVLVSASQRTGEEGAMKTAAFVSATPDGSVAYLLSRDQLTDAATTSEELYRYDAATGQLSLLTGGAAGGTGGEVLRAIPSADGTHLYFTARGALSPEAEAGKINAYVWDGSDVRFIATLDAPATESDSRFARISPDGRYAVLETSASLAGANNEGRIALYVYDNASGTLQCGSCTAQAAQSDALLGESSVPLTLPAANEAVGAQRQRNLTDDGRLLFMTADQLVSQDTNSVIDVYEWADGKISLLSDGRGDQPSFVADSSDNGEDVFILTRSQLVGADHDEVYDLYDVRVGGGFREPQSAPEACDGDACQGSVAPPPASSISGSAAFRGRGNHRQGLRARIHLRKLRPTDRLTLARGGKVRLRLMVTLPGKVRINGVSRIGHRKLRVIAASAYARQAGVITVPIALSRGAVAAVERQGSLQVKLSVRVGSAHPKRVRFRLRYAAGKGGAR